MTPVELVFDWIEHTPLSLWVRGDSMFAFPLILTVHTIGMGFVAGTSWAVSLRVAGFVPQVPLKAMANFYPVLWLAFAANAVSGVLLFIGYPYKAATNPVFYTKLALIALGLHLMVKLHRAIVSEPNEARRQVRHLAVAAMLSWAGAITAGRLLAYTFTWLRVGIPGGF